MPHPLLEMLENSFPCLFLLFRLLFNLGPTIILRTFILVLQLVLQCLVIRFC